MQSSRPFLKWPGGKYRLLDRILPALAEGERLIEPFAGSCAVMLGSNYKSYLIADINDDIIVLYRQLQQEGEDFINYCRSMFHDDNNCAEAYYALRDEFNHCADARHKSALFVYLNRHTYNGLCRYNSSGHFNSPFGRYKQPYFPLREMRAFIHKSQGDVSFIHRGFTEVMRMAKAGDVVYCDPPYIPLSTTAKFTNYSSGGFSEAEQCMLASLAEELARQGITVVISNHDGPLTRKLYAKAHEIIDFPVQRMISQDITNRGLATELLAIYKGYKGRRTRIKSR